MPSPWSARSAPRRAAGLALLALAAWAPSAAAQEIIVTIAGAGTLDDPQRAALQPFLVAAAPDGSTYIGATDLVLHLGTDGRLETAAGTGNFGSPADGAAALGANLTVEALACDARGDVYIGSASAIYKLDHLTGRLAVVAGSATASDLGDGGPATSASIAGAYGLVITAAGDLVFSDNGHARVRRVAAATGTITTIAGTGTADTTGDGGPATAAAVDGPSGLALDAAGNLYIADPAAARVRRIAAGTGTITTVAGGASGAGILAGQAATLSTLVSPQGVCCDAAGTLYIADGGAAGVLAVGSAGLLTRCAGTGVPGFAGDGGPAAAALLGYPVGVACTRDGRLLIADEAGRVRAVALAAGTISTLAGGGAAGAAGDGGPATLAQFGRAAGIAFAPGGDLYIADQTNNCVRRMSMTTGIVTGVAGTGAGGFSGDGGPATAATMSNPARIAFDRAGDLLIADQNNARIRKVDAGTGTITTIAGGGAATGDGGLATGARLVSPVGIFVAANGDIYVADIGAARVRRVEAATGRISTVAGGGSPHDQIGDGGPATSAEADNAVTVILDGGGNVLLTDTTAFTGRGHIRRVSAADGTISTIAGTYSPGSLLLGDGGQATAASFGMVTGLLFDAGGGLLASDRDHNRVRRIAPGTGIVSTIVGTGVPGFAGDGGPPAAAQLNAPSGTAFAPDGSLVIGDQGNHRIRMVTSSLAPVAWVAAPLVYGAALGAGQLTATTATAGTFTYTPPAGTRLGVGAHLLSATFTPAPALHLPPILVSTTVLVAPAPLLVVADDQHRAAGAPDPAFTWHLSGLVGGDDASVVNGAPALATTATSGSPDGAYPISVGLGGMSAVSYVLAGSPGTLTIGSAPSPGSGGSGGGGGGCGHGALAAVGALLALLLALRSAAHGRRPGA